MKLFACRYAVVHFAPCCETGSFASAGVVLMCPESGYFGFKLQTRCTQRMTDGFGELQRSFYMHAVKAMEDELQRVAHGVAKAPGLDRAAHLQHVFDSLMHPRQSLLRFSGSQAVMTFDPVAELARQFAQAVESDSSTLVYVEEAMDKRS